MTEPKNRNTVHAGMQLNLKRLFNCMKCSSEAETALS